MPEKLLDKIEEVLMSHLEKPFKFDRAGIPKLEYIKLGIEFLKVKSNLGIDQ